MPKIDKYKLNKINIKIKHFLVIMEEQIQRPQCACVAGMAAEPNILPPDEKGGKRYECYYCKFKWRVQELYETICKGCESHGMNVKKHLAARDSFVKCFTCGQSEPIRNFKPFYRVMLW